MPKLLLLLIFSSFLYSCKNRDGEYINHDKWRIEDVYTPINILKGSPKEVRESQHFNLPDTLIDVSLPEEPVYYLTYKFNAAGDIISTKASFANSPEFSESQLIYDKNGQQYKFFTHDIDSATKTVLKSQIISTRTGPGKYKEEFYRDGVLRYTNEISFLNKGKKILTKRFQGDSLLFSVSKYYSGNRILEVEGLQKDIRYKRKYYYSDKGFLDSIISFGSNGQPDGGKEIFINDENGNTIYYENMGENEKISIKYKFDSIGNWVRQLVRYDTERKFKIGNPDRKFSNYNMVVREIKY